MTQNKPKLTHADLMQFTGDLERYKTIHPKVVYTPGVRHMALQGEAYWLIDAIVSYFPTRQMRTAMEKDERIRSLQFWRLEVSEEQTATLSARADSGVDPFIVQEIPYTDFPLEQIEVWAGFDDTRWTLYLPSEH